MVTIEQRRKTDRKRPERWRKRKIAEGYKQIQLIITPKAQMVLNREKERTGEPFVQIINRGIKRLLTLIHRRRPLEMDPFQPVGGKPFKRVLVVGLGPAGRQVVHTLVAQHLEPVIIDVNPKNREYAKQQDLRLYLGDASHEEILTHAGLAEICMVVITIPDTHAVIRIVEIIRRLRPHVPIAVRCRYNRHLADLKRVGVDIVVDEEISMGDMLSRQIVDYLKDDSGALVACLLGGQTPELINDRAL